MQFDLQPVELGPLVRDVLAMQEPMAAEMALSMRVEAEQRAVARADPRRTWEVLQNLVSNAIKYNRRNGQVVLRLGADERHAWVEVADTGLGLSSEQQAHLFEPFNRLGADQMKVEGSGLGLAIARAMAHAMDGSLQVRSELGLGSTFTLRLPRSAGD
jgi:signal transduction histidine kinase